MSVTSKRFVFDRMIDKKSSFFLASLQFLFMYEVRTLKKYLVPPALLMGTP